MDRETIDWQGLSNAERLDDAIVLMFEACFRVGHGGLFLGGDAMQKRKLAVMRQAPTDRGGNAKAKGAEVAWLKRVSEAAERFVQVGREQQRRAA